MTRRSRTRIKICGLTRTEDVRLAVELGADAVGFVLWPGSPRAVSVEQVRRISEGLPPFVARVGVFVGASPDHVRDAQRDARLTAVQLHGQLDLEQFRAVNALLIRATSLVTDEELEAVQAWPSDVTPIVDAHDPERHGGTGRTADWTRAAVLSEHRAIVLAGGLTAENVRRATEVVRPWAVDVSSGVETSPGLKDPGKLRAFIGAVRGSEEESR